MALILNIDTCSKSTSVALAENDVLLQLQEEHDVVSHASKLTPFIEVVLKQADKKYKDLDAIAVSIGPGSYTGLRIGLSTAKGLSYALKLPIIAVCPLKAMTLKLKKKHTKNNKLFVSTMKSRKNEIYCASLEEETGIFNEPSSIILDSSFLEQYKNEDIVLAGSGLEKVKSVLKNPNASFIEELIFSAENLIPIANKKYLEKDFEDLAYLEPNYLKPFITI